MILQILPDAGDVGVHRYADPFERRRRSDAGEHQELRRIDGAGGKHHFACGTYRMVAAVPTIGAADGAPSLEQDLRCLGAGADGQVGTPPRRIEIGAGRTPAAAVPDVGLIPAEAFLNRAVEILGGWVAYLAAGLEICGKQWIVGAGPAHVELAADTVIGICAAFVILAAHEIGQHVPVAPAGVAERSPVVVIVRVAPDIQHACNDGTAAQHSAARPVDLPPVELVHGPVVPIVEPAPEQLAGNKRHPIERIPSGASGFQRQDAVFRIGA